MTVPKVSIIIPTYNRADFLAKAIRSVIAQTYPDWELIIWNDGSTDNTEAVVRTFQDGRIQYHYEVNHGKSYALNRALEFVRGEFVAFLDDDDRWFEDKTDLQIKILLRHPEVDVLLSDFNNENLTTGECGTGFAQTAKGLKRLVVQKIEEDVFLIKGNFPQGIKTANFLLPSSTILRAQVIKKVGNFNEELRSSLDIEYFWRIFLHGYSFAYINKILVNRIKPLGSLSSARIGHYQDVIKCTDSCKKEAIIFKQAELVKLLKISYKRAWLGMIRAYARSGERKKAFNAFFHSLAYGINIKGLYYLMGAIAGPELINKMKKL